MSNRLPTPARRRRRHKTWFYDSSRETVKIKIKIMSHKKARKQTAQAAGARLNCFLYGFFQRVVWMCVVWHNSNRRDETFPFFDCCRKDTKVNLFLGPKINHNDVTAEARQLIWKIPCLHIRPTFFSTSKLGKVFWLQQNVSLLDGIGLDGWMNVFKECCKINNRQLRWKCFKNMI